MIWLYGYGWPIYRGGPMFYADQVGLKHIADRLSYYAKETNDPSLEPSPLLKRLAAEGKHVCVAGRRRRRRLDGARPSRHPSFRGIAKREPGSIAHGIGLTIPARPFASAPE